MSYTPNDIKQYFLLVNRNLTAGLILILLVVSLIFWYTGSATLQTSSLYIGAAFMILAVVFYQLPYVSFLLTRRKFSAENKQGIEILDSGWKVFKQWVDA